MHSSDKKIVCKCGNLKIERSFERKIKIMKIYLLLKFGLCGPEAPISGFVKVKVAYGAPKACLTTELSKNQYRIFFHPILGKYE